MAVITPDELAAVRRRVAKKAKEKDVPIHWVKGEINATLQGLDDLFDSAAFASAISDKIEAEAPGVFDPNEKRYLFAYFLELRARREEVDL